MCVFALKISSIVTALGLLTGTAAVLTDTHTIGVLAYQGEAEAIARWERTAQVLSGQLAPRLRIPG